LGAAKDEQLPMWQTSLSSAQATMAALRDAGLLDEIMPTKEGLVVYPAGMRAE
jgi:hypothetical protein